MYAAIRKYSVKPGWMDEVMQRIQQDFVFLISQELGFLNYYALRVGSNDVLTFSVFDTQYEAEGSTSLGFQWVQENLVGYLHKESGGDSGTGIHECLGASLALTSTDATENP